MKISVVIPVYNEVKTIDELVSCVYKIPLEKEIIIVDDGSTDGTREHLEVIQQMKDVTILLHEKNRGKGAALRTGFEAVTGDIIIIQDADLEYDPQDYAVLLEPICDNKADVVYGSRFLGGPHRILFFWHYVGNKFLTLLSNMLGDMNFSDMETCYKAFKRDVIKDIKIKSDRFGFEPEFTMKISKRRLRVYEVPISYSGRTYMDGKKITWKDGFKAIFTIIWFRFFD